MSRYFTAALVPTAGEKSELTIETDHAGATSACGSNFQKEERHEPT
jgi:hypothetical protein